jgi:hypothetical protein
MKQFHKGIIMKKTILKLMALGFLVSPIVANAAIVTFEFNGGDSGLTSVVKTVDGLTLTVDNFSPASTSVADSDGLCLTGIGGFCPDLNSLDLTFSSAVRLVSYQVGFLSGDNEVAELLFSQGSNSSLETNFVDEAVASFVNQFVANGGDAVNLSASSLAGPGSLQFRLLTVDTNVTVDPNPVSAPATLALFALALFGLTSRKFKRALKV